MEKPKPPQKSTKIDWRGLFLLTQLGFSIMVPPVFCLLAARWAAGRFSLGGWIYIAAMILGLGAAFSSARELVRPLCRSSKKEDESGSDSDRRC